jgi:hypothetical protein
MPFPGHVPYLIALLHSGSPKSPKNFKPDGVLQTWIEGPGFGPLLVLDKQDMSWRQYNNVSIDTLYFSVFFGGSSPSFMAKKDEVSKGSQLLETDLPFSVEFLSAILIFFLAFAMHNVFCISQG